MRALQSGSSGRRLRTPRPRVRPTTVSPPLWRGTCSRGCTSRRRKVSATTQFVVSECIGDTAITSLLMRLTCNPMTQPFTTPPQVRFHLMSRQVRTPSPVGHAPHIRACRAQAAAQHLAASCPQEAAAGPVAHLPLEGAPMVRAAARRAAAQRAPARLREAAARRRAVPRAARAAHAGTARTPADHLSKCAQG